ncbi:MAG: molecular chaperone HtpG [Candidatus Delongbacteria bacterium]|nr:molecular chaperone HtpG [Candidatus Delongbacteria bacterium]
MTKSTMKFKTEVSQLLELVTHSLYSNKEIFIRELVSNASDALDKIRLEGLMNKKLLEGTDDYKIKIDFNKDAGTITITDTGIGMTKDEVISNIGTIAKSGTKEFFTKLKEMKESEQQQADLIGQFGVGFYSAFIVSEKIVINTKKAGKDSVAVRWESDGKEKFSVDDSDRTERGTEVTLYLNKDDIDYASEWKIKEIVKKYSDYISYPINMTIEREEKPKDKDGKEIEGAEALTTYTDETINSQKAIWQRAKKDVKKEEYNEFYKHISHDYEEPLEKIHLNVEGMLSYKALLYFPMKAPYDLFIREAKTGVSLYVKNVFIMEDNKHLLPEYLRFMKGVVDSADLPLNVSREILQEDKTLEKIQKNLVKKIIETLKKLKEKQNEKYLEFYAEFGKVLKEGVYSDHPNQEKLSDLILFESSKTEAGKLTSLAEYVEKMPEGQTEIYYITGESRKTVENSPHLEKFKQKDYDVLFFTDPIDEFITTGLTEYKEKKLKSVGKGEIDLADEKEKETEKKQKDSDKKKYGSVLDNIKEALKDDIKDVKISNRLTSSAVCLVSDENDISPHMEKIFKSMNQEVPVSKRILELNPNHPILDVMKSIYDNDKKDAKLGEYAEMLYDQAVLSEGTPLKDPVKFAQRMADLMVFEGKTKVAKK